MNPVRMLVAEDVPDIADIVRFAARMVWPDCEVAIAGSGEEALKLFSECSPDICVLDIGMPPPDGFEVLRRIREDSTAPILMLTVRESEADRARAQDLGADGYLVKPFDPVELLACLRALVDKEK